MSSDTFVKSGIHAAIEAVHGYALSGHVKEPLAIGGAVSLAHLLEHDVFRGTPPSRSNLDQYQEALTTVPEVVYLQLCRRPQDATNRSDSETATAAGLFSPDSAYVRDAEVRGSGL